VTRKDDSKMGWGLQTDLNINLDSDLNGQGLSETLKFSCCKNVIVEGNNHKVIGGIEDCLDIVRGCNYTFRNIHFITDGTKQHVTAKSGLQNVVFENCTFSGKPKTACVVMGQYSDYNILKMPKTQHFLFKNCKFEYKKQAIQLWFADNVVLENTDAKINKIPGIVVWTYFTFRKIQDKMKYGRFGRGGQTPEGIENVKRNCCL